MNYPTTIALIGDNLAARRRIAEYLSEVHGYKHLPLATPQRILIEQLLLVYGYDTITAQYHLTRALNQPLTRLPGEPTVRYLLSTLANDWGRATVHRDLWLDAWRVMAADYPGVVVDDADSPGDLAALRSRANSATWCIGACEPELRRHLHVDAVPPEATRKAVMEALG